MEEPPWVPAVPSITAPVALRTRMLTGLCLPKPTGKTRKRTPRCTSPLLDRNLSRLAPGACAFKISPAQLRLGATRPKREGASGILPRPVEGLAPLFPELPLKPPHLASRALCFQDPGTPGPASGIQYRGAGDLRHQQSSLEDLPEPRTPGPSVRNSHILTPRAKKPRRSQFPAFGLRTHPGASDSPSPMARNAGAVSSQCREPLRSSPPSPHGC